MPLFMCTACGVFDNTATSGYWMQQMQARQETPDEIFKPLCSQCNPAIGKWHGEWPRQLPLGWKQDRRGFIWRVDELARVPKDLGPFTDVVIPDQPAGMIQ